MEEFSSMAMGGLTPIFLAHSLVIPHLSITYELANQEAETVRRVTEELPVVPKATEPHPHTMKLGEFLAHAHLLER
jgi:DNA topoisomerase VI, subunit B